MAERRNKRADRRLKAGCIDRREVGGTLDLDPSRRRGAPNLAGDGGHAHAGLGAPLRRRRLAWRCGDGCLWCIAGRR